jgi:hypothetical protein
VEPLASLPASSFFLRHRISRNSCCTLTLAALKCNERFFCPAGDERPPDEPVQKRGSHGNTRGLRARKKAIRETLCYTLPMHRMRGAGPNGPKTQDDLFGKMPNEEIAKASRGSQKTAEKREGENTYKGKT